MALPETQRLLDSEGNRPFSLVARAPVGGAATPFFRSGYRCGFTGNRGLGQRAWHPTAESR